MVTAAVPHRSRADDVYAQLKRDVAEFKLVPGDRFSETDIGARLGVSRTPVREALFRLRTKASSTWRARPAGSSSRSTSTGSTSCTTCASCWRPPAWTAWPAARVTQPRAAGSCEGGCGWCRWTERLTDGHAVGRAGRALPCPAGGAAGNREMARVHQDVTERIRIVRRLDFTRGDRIDATYAEHAKILRAVIQRKRRQAAKLLLRAHIEQSKPRCARSRCTRCIWRGWARRAEGRGADVRFRPAAAGAFAQDAGMSSDAAPSLTPAFNRLAWANLAAQSAEQLSLAAVPLVAVLLLRAGPGEVGLLAAVQTLPFLLLSIPLGLLADRFSRRRLMVLAELLRALSLVLLLAMVLTGELSVAWLAVVGFAGAVGTVGFSVAAPALVPALVPRAALARANGRLELARSVAYAAGPALAGALVAWLGGAAAFVLAALLSAAAVLLLRALADPPRSLAPARHPWQDIRDGLGFVWRHPHLQPMRVSPDACPRCPPARTSSTWSLPNTGFELGIGVDGALVGGVLQAPGLDVVPQLLDHFGAGHRLVRRSPQPARRWA
jgi:MFS family permease